MKVNKGTLSHAISCTGYIVIALFIGLSALGGCQHWVSASTVCLPAISCAGYIVIALYTCICVGLSALGGCQLLAVLAT